MEWIPQIFSVWFGVIPALVAGFWAFLGMVLGV